MKYLWFGLLSGAASACGGASTTADNAATEIVGGQPTFDRPEVGWTSFTCTGTLIRPRVVLTAAHCVDDRSEDSPDDYGSFTIQPSASVRHIYRVDRYRSFRNGSGHQDDLALLHLRDAVPETIATPASLSSARPARDQAVTMFGYGCEALPEESGFGVERDGTIITTGGEGVRKTKLPYRYGQVTQNGCPGDSGGPRITDDGDIFEVNSKRTIIPASGYGDVPLAGGDSMADVVAHRAALIAQISVWDEADRLEMCGDDCP